MNYAKVKEVPASTIPVIDISGLQSGGLAGYREVATAFLSAAEQVGFFYISNHGIDSQLIRDTFAISQEFFTQPCELKDAVRMTERHRGYLLAGEARMQGSSTPDLKESFIWGREFSTEQLESLRDNPMIGANRWPSSPAQMPEILNRYLEACIELGRKLLRVFAVSLQVDPDYFSASFTRTITRGSVLYYPPQPADFAPDQFGVAPHTDYGCLTLLCQDSTGGLQVLGRDGSWVTAHPIPDTYVVNIGDLLARWTNDRFRSTPHRVLNSSGRARRSVAVFIDPDSETVISPVVHTPEQPKYGATTCGEYILRRFDGSFAYRQGSDAKLRGS